MLFNTLYFSLISLSFSVMWSFSEIFSPVRNMVSRIPYIRKPLICPECSSFWIGFILSFFYNPIILNVNVILLSNIICGLITHLFAVLIYRNFIVKNKNNNTDKIEFL